jgi:cytochrome P450
MGAAVAAQQTPVPAHVPPELVLPIGLTVGKEFLAAPHAFMASLHDTHPPIFYSYDDNMPGAWLLTRHEDCFFVLRHPEIFTTAGATPFPRDPDDHFYMIPLEIDPPHHRKYRAIIDPMVSPLAVARLELAIRQLANELIDQFIDRGGCEFTTEFGRPLPVSVFLNLMGLPQDKRDTFVGWAMGLLHANDRTIMANAMREVVAYLKSVIKEKLQHPDDGAISVIAHASPDGNRSAARKSSALCFSCSLPDWTRCLRRSTTCSCGWPRIRTAAGKSSIIRRNSTRSSKSCCGFFL